MAEHAGPDFSVIRGGTLFSEELSLRLHEGKLQGAKFPFSSGGVFF